MPLCLAALLGALQKRGCGPAEGLPCRERLGDAPTCRALQVDDSGKVQRLRKVCPQCGPGIFMATHFNRVYCGKCHLTYVYDKEGAKA